MTELLSRRPPSADPVVSPASGAVLGRGVAVALRCAAVGLLWLGVLGVLLWIADDRSDVGLAPVLRAAAQAWLLAHGATLDLGEGTVSLAPLGLCGLVLLLLARSSRRTVRGLPAPLSAAAAGRFGLAVAVPYGLVAAVVAATSGLPSASPPLVPAVLAAATLALLGAYAGALWDGPGAQLAWARLPGTVRRTLVAGTAASAVLLAGGALTAGASLAWHLPAAADRAAALDPGVAGGAGLLLLGLSLVPNAAVWAAAWLAGPGFALGAGTSVSPFGVATGPVPTLPLLAAVPGTALPGWLAAVVWVVPVAAGVLAGLLLVRAAGRPPLREVLAVGGGSALTWATLAWLAGGAVGAGRLTTLGPDPLRLGLVVGVQVGLGALLTVVGVLLRRSGSTRD